MDRTRYVQLGTALFMAGAGILAGSLLLLRSYPGVSTGMALLVLGLVVLLLGKTAPGIAPELADLLARTGYENLGRLLEELGVRSRAVYLPAAVLAGDPKALIPLTERGCDTVLQHPLDNRLIVFCGKERDDAGLLVTTPGSAALSLLAYPPGETMDEIGVALTQLAVSTLKVARSVELHDVGDRVEVTYAGESAPSGWLSSVVESCLGSLLASIAAAIVAEAKGRRVSVDSESIHGSKRAVTLVLLPP
jgi:hypothetical protein